MADVAIGAQMRANLLSLQRTNSLMDNTSFNLSTGRKINSALDGAQAFFTSQALSNRASDLNRLLDSMGQSIQTIKAADKGITAMTTMVEQAQAISQQARDELSSSGGVASVTGDVDLVGVSDLTSLDNVADTNTFTVTVGGNTSASVEVNTGDSVYGLVEKINTALAGGTPSTVQATASLDANGQLKLEAANEGDAVRIAAGTISQAGLADLGLGAFVGTEADGAGGIRTGGTVVGGNTLTSNASASATPVASDTLGGVGGAGFLNLTAGTATIEVIVNGGEQSSSLAGVDNNTTIQELIDDINTDLGETITASFNQTTGSLEMAAGVGVSTIEFKVTMGNPGAGDSSFGFGAGGADASGLLADQAVSEVITLTGGSANVAQLAADYNEIRAQIDSLVEDANYRGVNLLKGDDLTTTFNEDGSNTMVTKGADFTASGLGLAEADFTNIASATTTWQQAKEALNSVRDFGGSISNSLTLIQTRETFTQDTIQVLEEGSDKLTLADPNEEGAKMLALQTRLQLGVTSMSLASQSEQSVLSLFG